MTAVSHILIATDGSANAHKAAAFAGEIARAFKARISVLFVQSEELILSNAWGAGAYAQSIDELRNKFEEHAKAKELPEAVKAVGPIEGEIDSVMLWGRPADEICRFAAERDVDLVVVGSHGRSGIKKALLGSISHAVVNQAPCPVTVVR